MTAVFDRCQMPALPTWNHEMNDPIYGKINQYLNSFEKPDRNNRKFSTINHAMINVFTDTRSPTSTSGIRPKRHTSKQTLVQIKEIHNSVLEVGNLQAIIGAAASQRSPTAVRIRVREVRHRQYDREYETETTYRLAGSRGFSPDFPGSDRVFLRVFPLKVTSGTSAFWAKGVLLLEESAKPILRIAVIFIGFLMLVWKIGLYMVELRF